MDARAIMELLALGIGGVALPVAGIVWALIEWRGKKVFVGRDEHERLEKMVIGLEEVADGNRDRIQNTESETRMVSQRVTEAVIEPLQRLMSQLNNMATEQQAHGKTLVQLERDTSALGRSIDDLRQQLSRIREGGP